MRARWAWAEPAVWTDRMLNALENGVKGGVWFSLFDKVFSPANLKSAWTKVRANRGSAGVDRQSVERFSHGADAYLNELHEELRRGTYRPMPVLRAWIPKPGTGSKRPLGIPTVKDRVAQAALKNVLEPIFEKEFSEFSYGFRPGRSAKDALRRVDSLLKQGRHWVVDADIEGFFDNIGHEVILAGVKSRVADGRVLSLVESFLKQEVLEADATREPEGGTPQGAVMSPLLANIALHPVDVAMRRAGFETVRYADDMVVMCQSEIEAESALELLRQLLTGIGLKLHAEKTRVTDERNRGGGFDFLGYRFERGHRLVRGKSLKALREKLRPQTRRNSGMPLSKIIASINPVLRGWYEYFKHAVANILTGVDSWVRRRLRSILRRRRKRKGIGRGLSNMEWPNAFFAEAGLFSLETARNLEVRSRCGNR